MNPRILLSVSSRQIEIGGARYAIVPARDLIEHLTEGDARAMLERILEEDPTAAASRIRSLAEDLDFGFFGGTREAVAIVARAIALGRIVPVRLRHTPPRLDAPSPVELRELGGDPPASTLRPDRPDHDEPGDAPPAPTWVSFEVVDDANRPAHGRFRLVVDASGEEGDLDARAQRRSDLRHGARVRLKVTDLRWEPAVPREVPSGPPSDPAAITDSREDVLSVELVDERGNPLFADYAALRDEREIGTGTIAHRLEQSLPAAEAEAGITTLRLVRLRPHESARQR